jgi:hypothetical protein
MRHMEYTAMYAGTPQQCGAIGPDGEHYGYGYIDNILFDTLKPQIPTGQTTTAYFRVKPFGVKRLACIFGRR